MATSSGANEAAEPRSLAHRLTPLQCEGRDLSSGRISAKRQPNRRQKTVETAALSRPLLHDTSAPSHPNREQPELRSDRWSASLVPLSRHHTGRHDNYGSAFAAQPGKSQGRPNRLTDLRSIKRSARPSLVSSGCPLSRRAEAYRDAGPALSYSIDSLTASSSRKHANGSDQGHADVGP
jgi:hypothetical protein